ncbi:MAG: transglutaminase-like enzyme, predicted cysteine protease [Firmicutes bacterium]|nr:transglutaminase-like enzyme, predicted cysteine protease [Bacillota bacterium]
MKKPILIPETNDMNKYLINDAIIDYTNVEIQKLASYFLSRNLNETELVKEVYEFVRDKISHSFDIKAKIVTCSASEVLFNRHGICFAKAHLFAAILRCLQIPTGFCYQKLILDDETHPVIILHGLNAVYLKKFSKWIRLDARGNKPKVDAQFCTDTEKLAFNVRQELGETDEPTIYSCPNINVIKALKTATTVEYLYKTLPQEL